MVYLTYVGSFPLKNTSENLIRATQDVLSIPVDYPNYVQLDDMVHQFLQPISESGSGLVCEGEKYRLTGKLKLPRKPIATEALKILLELRNNRQFKNKLKGIKACVTGPFTLSSMILLNFPSLGMFGETALSDLSVVTEISKIVSKIAEDYCTMGADYVTIDEPMLSIIVGHSLLLSHYTDTEIIEIINIALSHIIGLNGIHVCGKISKRLAEILLQTNIDILDHEFKDSETNFNVYKKTDFERHNKKIGFAVASSKVLKVESLAEIELMLKRGIEAFGKENISMVKPDCGFRGLNPQGNLESVAYISSIAKLRNIRLVLNSLQRKKIL